MQETYTGIGRMEMPKWGKEAPQVPGGAPSTGSSMSHSGAAWPESGPRDYGGGFPSRDRAPGRCCLAHNQGQGPGSCLSLSHLVPKPLLADGRDPRKVNPGWRAEKTRVESAHREVPTHRN